MNHLTKQQHKNVRALLLSRQSVFSDEIKCSKQHKICFDGTKLIKQNLLLI